MRRRGLRAVIITRGLLLAIAASLIAFILVFIGAMDVISGARLAIGQKYVMRAVADTSGTFYSSAKWENKDGERIGIQIVKFIFGVDLSTPYSVIASVTGNIPTEPITDTAVMAKAVVNVATPAPSASVATKKPEPPPTPKIIEQKILERVGTVSNNGNIAIKNETNINIDVNQMLNAPTPFKVNVNKPTVLIVHTHTTESYTSSARFKFTHSETDRTTDTRYSVARVGDELETWIGKYKISVIHDKTIHDYPEYIFAYDRALKTINSNLAKYPSIKIVIDLHRDAIYDNAGNKMKITDVINNEKVAQVMTVVGTNQLVKHDNWRTNLKFAMMLQQQYMKISPSFARPINLRAARFNAQTALGAVIIEVGSNGNTLDESLASCQYIAKAISGVVQQLK